MHIKFSKTQWEQIGKQAGWLKEANNQHLVLSAAQFILNIIQIALSQKPQNNDQLRSLMYDVAQQQGSINNRSIKLPKTINPDQNIDIKIFPESSDGKTYGETQGNTIRLYTDAILKNPQDAYSTIIHELAHIFEQEGSSPDEDIDNLGERTVKYLTNDGEINAFAWQIAATYNQMFPNEQLNISKLSQLAQKYASDNRIQAYLVKFPLPSIQEKYSHIVDLAKTYNTLINKIQAYINYILES